MRGGAQIDTALVNRSNSLMMSISGSNARAHQVALSPAPTTPALPTKPSRARHKSTPHPPLTVSRTAAVAIPRVRRALNGKLQGLSHRNPAGRNDSDQWVAGNRDQNATLRSRSKRRIGHIFGPKSSHFAFILPSRKTHKMARYWLNLGNTPWTIGAKFTLKVTLLSPKWTAARDF